MQPGPTGQSQESTSSHAEVVIIGGGIIGCSTAYYLAKRGVPAVLYEKGEIAGEQSSRNWGFVRQQGRDPVEVPLMIECNRMWQGLEAELEADLEWIQGGNLALANDQDKLAQFEQWLDVARAYRLNSKVLTNREIKNLIPDIEGSWAGGLYTPSDGQAEPTKVTAAFRRATAARGATIHANCAVDSIETRNGAVSGVIIEKGETRTETVVCAAGVWSSKLARSLGQSLPQLWMRGTVARTMPTTPVTPAAVWSKLAFRQLKDGSFNIATGFGADYDLMINTLRHFRPFIPN